MKINDRKELKAFAADIKINNLQELSDFIIKNDKSFDYLIEQASEHEGFADFRSELERIYYRERHAVSEPFLFSFTHSCGAFEKYIFVNHFNNRDDYDYETNVLIAFAECEILSGELLESFLLSLIEYDRSFVRSGSRTHELTERKSMSDIMIRDYVVRLVIARRRDITPKVLDALSNDYSFRVRLDALRSSCATLSFREKFINDPSLHLVSKVILFLADDYRFNKEEHSKNDIVTVINKAFYKLLEDDDEERYSIIMCVFERLLNSSPSDEYPTFYDFTENYLSSEIVSIVISRMIEREQSYLMPEFMKLKSCNIEMLKKIIKHIETKEDIDYFESREKGVRYCNTSEYWSQCIVALGAAFSLDSELKSYIVNSCDESIVIDLINRDDIDVETLVNITKLDDVNKKVIDLAKSKLDNIKKREV